VLPGFCVSGLFPCTTRFEGVVVQEEHRLLHIAPVFANELKKVQYLADKDTRCRVHACSLEYGAEATSRSRDTQFGDMSGDVVHCVLLASLNSVSREQSM